AISSAVIRATPVDPLAVLRFFEHRVGHRSEGPVGRNAGARRLTLWSSAILARDDKTAEQHQRSGSKDSRTVHAEIICLTRACAGSFFCPLCSIAPMFTRKDNIGRASYLSQLAPAQT